MFQTSIIDPMLVEKIIKTASIKTVPKDVIDQVEDEAKGVAPYKQARIAAKLQEIELLQFEAERVLRRIVARKEELRKEAKAWTGLELIDHPHDSITTACVNKECLDVDDALMVWNNIILRLGAKANFGGGLAFFRSSYAKRFREGKVKKPLPAYVADSNIPGPALGIPRSGETIDRWYDENRTTAKTIDAFEIMSRDSALYIKQYEEQANEVKAKIERYAAKGGKLAERIPTWQKDLAELESVLEKLKSTTTTTARAVETIRTNPVTTVDYELEVRKAVQKAIEAQGAMFAKDVLQKILGNINDQINDALRNIRTTSKNAGMMDSVLEFFVTAWKKLTNAVKFIANKVSELMGINKELVALASITVN